MDTVRVNICYRPLRICWAIAAGDHVAFRKAVRLTHTLWGGRFNPIVIVDNIEQAERIVEVFRADFVVPIGTSEVVRAFPQRFPHLIKPFFHDELFISGNGHRKAHAQILDIHNALVHLRDSTEWKAIKEKGLRLYSWDETDPLADTLLMHLGGYPDAADTHLDYRELVKSAGDTVEQRLDRNEPIPGEIFEHPSANLLARFGLTRHYTVQSNWDYQGFYLGDASNLDDLVNCWNLRAADTAIWFIDRNNIPRYAHVIPMWKRITKDALSYRQFEHQRNIAIWARRDGQTESANEQAATLQQSFGEGPYTMCGIDLTSWNGLNLLAPTMVFGETSQLGVMADSAEKPKVSFVLGDKPFSSERWFHTQHLVASLSFLGGLYGDDFHTLNLPYIPELNEFYARTMHFQYNKFRVEPGRIGLVIDAADSDAFIYALPIADLIEKIFKLAGFNASPSAGGLITRQIITQLGGLRGAAVFKIPGARRLLKTYGPTDTFTRSGALQLIGCKDHDNPDAKFEDFEDLYIEARQIGTKLSPSDVFTYLVEKGLFRIGSRLTCPHCRMSSWVSLDLLKQRIGCEMCGREFDATRQLVTGEPHYRRSGVLGAEKNAQGAVPVALTLQQLEINLGQSFSGDIYATSLELVSENVGLPKCEIDFVWLVVGRYPEATTIILGECKDRGRENAGDGATITARDIDNLKAVADAFPRKRFESFVLLAKLCSFTPDEIAAAKTINGPYHRRVIMLTERELEPWHVYERTNDKLKFDFSGHSAEQLAQATNIIYFQEAKQE